jgi:hypothetical protein
MGGVCSMLAGMHTKFYLEDVTMKEHLGELGAEDNIKLDT